METIEGLKRSHMCGELTKNDVGKKVTLMGWVHTERDFGSLCFIDLRDRSGIVQLVFNEKNNELLQKARTLRKEYVIAVVGEVVLRNEDTINPNIPTGEIEIIVTELRILNKSETPPFMICEDQNVKEELRLKYRYLDLRRKEMQENIIFRHKVTKIARDYYDKHGFLEIETPMLIKSTPEGARDYLVPSRVHEGKFYALPQSPQLYKQLLMVAGMDRYMQIVKCFRDEDLRADRQPEFTQIDLEMSFVDVDDVISVNEGFLQKVFKELLNIDIKLPLPRLSYKEAMERFGSDKPDTRFGLELKDLTDIVRNCGFKVFTDAIQRGGSVRCINVEGGDEKLSRRDLDALVDFVKIYKAKGLAWMVITENEIKSPITKFLTKEEIKGILDRTGAKVGDIIMIVADRDEIVFDALGNLRCHLAEKLGLIDESRFDLLWVVDFPLFEYDEESKRYVAKHHPFTAPRDEDIEKLENDKENVRAKAYDIVLNGVEIGGGSIRIYNSELQQRMFDALGFTREEAQAKFGFLLEAFKYGTPPHGGMAYGLDRLVMLLCGCDSIRDVIAFPKVQNASELMTNAPDFVDEKQLRELHIKLR